MEYQNKNELIQQALDVLRCDPLYPIIAIARDMDIPKTTLSTWLLLTGKVPKRKHWCITKEHKEAISRATRARGPRTDAEKQLISQGVKEAWANNPLFREHMRVKAGMRSHPPHTEATKEKCRLWHMGVRPSEETREKLREATRGSKRRVGLKNTPEAIENMRRAQKKVWSDKDYAVVQQRRMKKAQSKRPTLPEKIVWDLLDAYYPGEWEYTGDGSREINGLFPDFIHRNGSNMVIEVFGDYWHKGEGIPYRNTEEGRIKLLAEVGYETLVIWESALENQQAVLEKIDSFVRGGKYA